MKKNEEDFKAMCACSDSFFSLLSGTTFSGIFSVLGLGMKGKNSGNARSHTHRPNFTKGREKGRWIDSHGAGRIRGPQGNVGHAGVQQRPPRLGQLAVSFVWHRCGTSKIVSQDARIVFLAKLELDLLGGTLYCGNTRGRVSFAVCFLCICQYLSFVRIPQ